MIKNGLWSTYVLVYKHTPTTWYQMNVNFHDLVETYQKDRDAYNIQKWTYNRTDNSDILVKQETVHNLGIDVDSSGASLLISKLSKLESTIDISFGGAYHQDQSYSQIWIKTLMSEEELGTWLYNARFPWVFAIVGVFPKEW